MTATVTHINSKSCSTQSQSSFSDKVSGPHSIIIVKDGFNEPQPHICPVVSISLTQHHLPHHCLSLSVLDTPVSLFHDSALYTSQTHHSDSGSSIPYDSPACHSNTLIRPFQSVIPQTPPHQSVTLTNANQSASVWIPVTRTEDPIRLPPTPAWNKARWRRYKAGLGRAGRWPSRGCLSQRTLPGLGRRLQPGGLRGKATWSRPGEGRLRAARRGRRGAYSAH